MLRSKFFKLIPNLEIHTIYDLYTLEIRNLKWDNSCSILILYRDILIETPKDLGFIWLPVIL